MSVAVVYASKKGFMKDAAKGIQEGLEGQAELMDLFGGKMGDPGSYDVIILASAIRAGHFPGKFRKFCRDHVPQWTDKKIVLLVGGLDENSFKEAVNRNLSPEIQSHFWKAVFAGGRYLPEQHNYFIRGLMKKINKESGPIHREKWDNIDSLVQDVKAL